MESMSAVDLKTRAFVDDVLVRSPFGKTLGFELVSLEPDKVRLRLPFKPENVTLENIVHGIRKRFVRKLSVVGCPTYEYLSPGHCLPTFQPHKRK